MNEELAELAHQNMEARSTEELLQIWQTEDPDVWSPEVFEATRMVLEARGTAVDPQPAAKRAAVRRRPILRRRNKVGLAVAVALLLLGACSLVRPPAGRTSADFLPLVASGLILGAYTLRRPLVPRDAWYVWLGGAFIGVSFQGLWEGSAWMILGGLAVGISILYRFWPFVPDRES